MGDVNMDGVVDLTDAQLVLESYTLFFMQFGHSLSEEQLTLANVIETEPLDLSNFGLEPDGTYPTITDVTLSDAQVILNYYIFRLTDTELPDIIGNTAQSPPDGLAAHLLAYFPSYCMKIPCWASAQRRHFHTI